MLLWLRAGIEILCQVSGNILITTPQHVGQVKSKVSTALVCFIDVKGITQREVVP